MNMALLVAGLILAAAAFAASTDRASRFGQLQMIVLWTYFLLK